MIWEVEEVWPWTPGTELAEAHLESRGVERRPTVSCTGRFRSCVYLIGINFLDRHRATGNLDPTVRYYEDGEAISPPTQAL